MMKGNFTKNMVRFVDGLDRNKTGRVMFGTGMIGFVVSGCCLDSKYWGVALLCLLLSVAVCYIAYGMCDLTESFKWESKDVRNKKAENRQQTYSNWIGNTIIPK